MAATTAKVEYTTEWGRIDGAKMLEYKNVKADRMTPDPKVSRVSSCVLTSGDEGFGRDAREVPWPFHESFCSLPVLRIQPLVGNGGGMAMIDVVKAM